MILLRMIHAPMTIPNEMYEAYERAFRTLQSVAHDPSVSIMSVALEVERLLASCPQEMRCAVSLALGDALGCLPPKSRTHLSRILEQRRAESSDPTNRQ